MTSHSGVEQPSSFEPGNRRPGGAAGEVDPATGEILAPRDMHERAERPADGEGASVEGERTIPAVNRERSIQSRIRSSLALSTILLLGAGFLFWYYGTQYSRNRESLETARRTALARAGGEMKVPPLGHIQPPRASDAASAASAGPPPAPAAAAANGGPPPKTPEELALERQLAAPVLRRAPMLQGGNAPAHASLGTATDTPSFSGIGGVPHMAQLLGAAPASGAATTSNGSSPLAANLKPTPTPAIAATMLATRRLLLPKGAFIDCTLETAIDSTYEGMTTCIGANDIYGADGKVVLLERGTKYVGEQRGAPRQGQGRVFILWNEARTPTGVVVQLASPGTDELGRNGLPGFVDTHFWERFGAAILVSVIDGTMQAFAAHRQGGSTVGGGTGVVLAPQGSRDVLTEILRSTVSMPPTVIKNQGERIQILVARDVDFRSVYALRTVSTPP